VLPQEELYHDSDKVNTKIKNILKKGVKY